MAEARRSHSYAALHAVLPTVRDRLTVDEAAQQAAQPRLLTRGIYGERWNPSSVPHKMSARDVVERVPRGYPFNITMSVQELAHGVVTASRNHLSSGQWDLVVAILPRELRSVPASQ